MNFNKQITRKKFLSNSALFLSSFFINTSMILKNAFAEQCKTNRNHWFIYLNINENEKMMDSTLKINGFFSNKIKVFIINKNKKILLFSKNFNSIGKSASRDKKNLLIEIPKKYLNKKNPKLKIESSSLYIKRSNSGTRKIDCTFIDKLRFNPISEKDNKQVVNKNVIEGYLNKDSFNPGEQIKVFVHCLNKNFDYKLIDKISGSTIYKRKNLSSIKQNYFKYSAITGLNWKRSFVFKVPLNLKSSLYSLRLESNNFYHDIPVIITNKTYKSDLAVVLHTNTMHAYNGWGDINFYQYEVKDKSQRNISKIISKNRPNKNAFTENHLFAGTIPFIKWLYKNNYTYEVLTDDDLKKNNSNLNKIKTLMFISHSEYWSEEMYTTVENFKNRGGNIISLGGNIAYFKINTFNHYIESCKDESIHLDGSQGGFWHLIGKPASKIFGSEYDSSGFDTFGPYEVLLPDHWIFNGLNLKKGDLVGTAGSGASGQELDKITKFSPKNILRLATGINKFKNKRVKGADMTYYETEIGSKVFSTGSITSVHNIQKDKQIQKILENVLKKLKINKV